MTVGPWDAEKSALAPLGCFANSCLRCSEQHVTNLLGFTDYSNSPVQWFSKLAA